jgi:D-alanyl-lipoteichoic acid acyltransferase DltB (MBOAT superfamily)
LLFPTFTFAAFFAVVLPVSWVLRRRPVPWKIFVLAASYWFYAAWDPRFVLLLVALTVGNEVAAIAIHRAASDGGRRLAVSIAVAGDLAVLGFFKYYDFFTDSLDRNLGISSPALDIVLPIGISFFTFQAISYVIDVHRRQTPPAPLLDLAVYLSFFPQLVAGPIVRATEFLPELRSRRVPNQVEAGRAVQLLGRGLFKKVVISDFLAHSIVNDTFGAPGEYGAIDMLFGIYGYAIQIYADFSGYTDMAIGVALLMGFRFPENFDRPYAAISVQDFWRRWHMTLSRWLRDYLYFPLGGNRDGRFGTYRNLLVTMALGGLWHGAAGTFVAWGLYHGAGLAAERMWADLRGESDRPLVAADVRIKELARLHSGLSVDAWREDPTSPTPFTPMKVRQLWLGRLVTFHFVCVGWVMFNSESLGRAGDVLSRLVAGWETAPVLLDPLIVAVIVGSIAAQYIPPLFARQWSAAFSSLPPTAIAVAFAGWIMLVVALGPEGVSEFIYFQF